MMQFGLKHSNRASCQIKITLEPPDAAAVVSELPQRLAFWTISYNWMKTKQEGASLLYKLTSIRVWLHMEEGGASCPAGERGRTREDEGGRGFVSAPSSTMSFSGLASPWLPVCQTLSRWKQMFQRACPAASRQRACDRLGSKVEEAGRYLSVRPYLIRTFGHDEWYVTSVAHVWLHSARGTKYLITPNCISVVTAVWTCCLLASKIMWGVKLTSASLRDVKFIVGIQFSSHNWTLSHLYPFFKLKFSFLIKADSSRV